MAKRELLSPAHDTASNAIISVQTATTRVKEIITDCVSKGIPDEELTKRLNAVIAQECKKITDTTFREQFRKSLVISARKWHYEISQTYRISEQNFRNAVLKQPLNIQLQNLLGKTPYQKQFEFRRLLDDGTNPGIPVIKDYQAGVKLAVKALSAEPAKIVNTKNGRTYIMPARLRAELAVRYAAAVENLQRLINDGVLFCWISSHPNCSPRCSKYQGKLYSLFSGKATLDGKEYKESGTIDGIPYRPINEALAGPNGDGNGCISGYNCRHRAIEYERGSKPPADYSEAEIKREYAIDKQQRDYENRIRQMKQEERQLRACGMEKEAKDLRKRWRILTRQYQMYSIQNDRAYYPYRYVIDRSEDYTQTPLTNAEEINTMEVQQEEVVPDIVQGKDLIGEIDYKNSPFDFDIETAMHAQGFDGLPKVVDLDEFKAAMEKSNFYAERTYSGATPEEVKEYQEQLYRGKWYVDCSAGGAQYGQGMYCAARFKDGKYIIPEDNLIGYEMSWYQSINQQKGKPYSVTEGITLQPDAKILTLYNDKSEIVNRYAKEYALKHAKTEQAKDLLRKMIDLQEKIDFQSSNLVKRDKELLEELYKQRNALYDLDVYNKEVKPLMYDAYNKTMRMDDGALAVEMGYDAINAQGHGRGGSYTVILNRTKVIFYKGGSLYGN